MCGIVGYCGRQPAAPIVLEGLRRVEYRGYDSAGMATLSDHRLFVTKDIGKLADWICENTGADTPLHFSRYFPCYKMSLPMTPVSTLETAKKIAESKLKYVYMGNV